MPRKSSNKRDGDVPKALKAITISKTTTTTIIATPILAYQLST